jgi:exodeoxyribonuclease VII small subunit
MDSPSDLLTFEQALQELEKILHTLEDGQTGLEESLGQYEKGVGLLKRCYTQLREAEQKILLLTGVDAEGQPITQPFQHTATAAAKRKRKKEDGPEILF